MRFLICGLPLARAPGSGTLARNRRCGNTNHRGGGLQRILSSSIYDERITVARRSSMSMDEGHDMKSEQTMRDPVCGMMVDPGTAKHRHVHDGQDYVFCSLGCKD